MCSRTKGTNLTKLPAQSANWVSFVQVISLDNKREESRLIIIKMVYEIKYSLNLKAFRSMLCSLKIILKILIQKLNILPNPHQTYISPGHLSLRSPVGVSLKWQNIKYIFRGHARDYLTKSNPFRLDLWWAELELLWGMAAGTKGKSEEKRSQKQNRKQLIKFWQWQWKIHLGRQLSVEFLWPAIAVAMFHLMKYLHIEKLTHTHTGTHTGTDVHTPRIHP